MKSLGNQKNQQL